MLAPADALPDSLCYLDGNYLPLRDAKVSVLDRGFIFGDGAYDVVPLYGGRPFCFDEHMARLDRSLAALRIANPLNRSDWLELLMHLVDASPAEERQQAQLAYIQVTRGVAPRRDHAMPPGIRPTVFSMLGAMKQIGEDVRAQGVACVSAEDFRWKMAHIKATSLLGAVLARQISIDAGATETIMFRDECLSEASSSNVWVVKDGEMSGPPRDELVLAGIRYGLLERICADAGIPFTLRQITRGEVFAADELLLSSASKEVLSVVTLDGRTIGAGTPGPVYRRLYEAYQLAKQTGGRHPTGVES